MTQEAAASLAALIALPLLFAFLGRAGAAGLVTLLVAANGFQSPKE